LEEPANKPSALTVRSKCLYKTTCSTTHGEAVN
jgi:hypothetical protein